MSASVPLLELRFWHDPYLSGPHFHVVRNERGTIVRIGATKEEAEAWAAERNCAPLTYGDISDRIRGPLGKSLVESMREHESHAADAMRYMLAAWSHWKPAPKPWLVRVMRRQRRWIACRLRDLADWFAA